MSEWDEPSYLVGVTEDFPGGNDDDLVQWAFEAGARWQAWQMKPRTITTAEELDALPVGSVVLDPVGISLHRDIIGWNASNGSRHIDREEIERDAFPATVLHEGDKP